MFSLIGEKIIEIPKSEIKDTICEVRVEFINSEYYPNPDNVLMADGTINYSSLITDLTHNKDRLEIVLKRLSEIEINHPIIVLGNRVEYLNELCNAYNERQFGTAICLSGMGMSKFAKEQRKKALKSLNDCEIDCIFATYQLAKEGLDVPNLRYIVFATPEKDETTVTQAAGRVARKFDGKEFGTVIDFVDGFGMYQGWKKKRERYYKKLNYDIIY